MRARVPFSTLLALLLTAAGLLLPLFLPALSPISPALCRLAAVFLLFCACYTRFSRPLKWLTFLLAGCTWTIASMSSYQSSRLPELLDLCHFRILGVVKGLPRVSPQKTRFDVIVQEAELLRCPSRLAGDDWPLWHAAGARIRLSLYRNFNQGKLAAHALENLQPDYQITALVRLRVPRGSANPGGFSYEAQLARQNIAANGYVNGEITAVPGSGLDSWRQIFSFWLERLPGLQHKAQMRALLIADHRGLTPDDWQLFKDTGSVHLMVVSGLHISLVAGLGWLFGFALAFILGVRRYWLTALMACSFALAYSLAAGFGVSAQRALVMVVVFAGASCLHRNVALSYRYLYSLIAVLIISPLAPLGAGFWLSFMAVLMLLLLIVCFHDRHQSWVRKLLWAQLALTMLLSPLLAYWQGTLAPASFFTNLLAVPWLSFLVMPSLLLALPIDALSLALGADIPLALQVPDKLLAVLYAWLSWLAKINPFTVQPSNWLLLAPLAALAVWLPLPSFARLAAACLWAIILFAGKPAGELPFRLVLLDVGQGFSAFVQSGQQAVVYDTGPRYSGGFDAGRDTVIPALRYFGVRSVSHIIVSHSDLDHAGGFSSLQDAWPDAMVIAGQPDRLSAPASACSGHSWHLGGARLRTLRPLPASASDNDASCVLEVTLNNTTLLFPGDLSGQGEIALLPLLTYSERTILFASHHGSSDASHADFLSALKPSDVLYSVGWHNRHGHPSAAACQRAKAVGARLFSTDRQGAIEWVLQGDKLQVGQLFRCQRYWWRSVDALDCHLASGLARCPQPPVTKKK